MNIGSLLTKTSRLHGDRLAIQYGEQQLTYTELNQRVGRLAQTLQTLGVRPGDRVALVQRNGPALFEALFACFPLVPLPSRSTCDCTQRRWRLSARTAKPGCWWQQVNIRSIVMDEPKGSQPVFSQAETGNQ